MPRYDARRRPTKAVVKTRSEAIFDDLRKVIVAYWPYYNKFGEGWEAEVRQSLKEWLAVLNAGSRRGRANFVRIDKVYRNQEWIVQRRAMKFSSRRQRDGQTFGVQTLKTKRIVNK